MKIFSENSGMARWGIPLVVLIVVGCFTLGMAAARFGGSHNLARPADELTATQQPPQPVTVTAGKSESVALQADPGKFQSAIGSAHALDRASKSITNRPQIKIPSKIDWVSETFGYSVKKRSLIAYVLGDGANTTMIFGDFHGNERSVPGVVENLQKYLTQHLEAWPDCRVILIPYANPDGWVAGTRVNAHQVDINRNFPGTWKAVGRAARYNPGPRAESEPETKAIEGLVKKYDPAKIISIHQPLHMLNWTGVPGRKLADVMHKANGYPISNDVGYATPGAFGDYCGGQHIAIVTMELPNIGVTAAWAENRTALLAAINAPL